MSEPTTKRVRAKKRDQWPVVDIKQQVAACPVCGSSDLKHLHGELHENGKFRVREKQCRVCETNFVVRVDVEIVYLPT
jgi:formate dehydrogenase maturation protein FdhE